VWAYFRVLAADHFDKIGMVYSLEKFNVHSKEPVSAKDVDAVEELKTLPRKGHFPIVEARVGEVSPEFIGHMPVNVNDLDGYRIWREAFDSGKGGVFTLPLEEI
jgi:hypothetical protein